jgi:hypothetical protein
MGKQHTDYAFGIYDYPLTLSQVFQEYAAAHSAIFLYGGRHVSSKIISPVLLAACELSDVLTSMVLLPFGLKRTSISGTFRTSLAR